MKQKAKTETKTKQGPTNETNNKQTHNKQKQ